MRSRMRGTPAQSGGSFRSVRDEDQLVAWSVGRFAYVVEEVAGGGERGSDLVAGAEAQHGVRGQPGAVGVEDEGPAERYDGGAGYGGSGSRVRSVWARSPSMSSGRYWMRFSIVLTVAAS